MEFFIYFNKIYSPEFIFPPLNFSLNLSYQFLSIHYKFNISYKAQIITSLLVSAILISAIPFNTIFLDNQTGFIITCLFLMILGLANAVLLNSLYGLLGYLPVRYLIWTRIGLNASGVFVNLQRFLVSLIVGTGFNVPEDRQRRILIHMGYSFFLVSGLVYSMNVVLVMVRKFLLSKATL